MSKVVPREVLQIVNSKTGKSVSSKDIQKLAAGVNSKTIRSERQLRQLIKQVSRMVNVPVSESVVNDIIRTVKQTGVGGMEQFINSMTKKNK